MPPNRELIEMPNGTAVFAQKDPHKYFPRKEDGTAGRQCLGVTTPVKIFDINPENLLKWAARRGYLGVAELFAEELERMRNGDLSPEEFIEGLSWLTSEAGIVRRLEAAGLDFNSIRYRKGKVGTNVHELSLRALAMGKPTPDYDALTEEEAGYTRGVVEFWLHHSPEASEVEQVVYSERLNVAGRLDVRGTIKECTDDRCGCHALPLRKGPGVIDAKTGFVGESAHVQVGGAYPLLSEEAGFGDTKWGAILSVDEQGRYLLLPAHGRAKSFEFAILAYREAQRVKNEAMTDRKRQTTDRKLAEQIDKAVAAA